ncbi:MAG: F0F1 ATP synthase subunit B' [Rhodobacteraceae bacterium]|nr:F0F1 ATP synthase subunit B' [Paracoccaceae bacterium]
MAAPESAEQAGIPQLDITAYPNQIFWFSVFALAVYLVVSRLAKPRIGSVIAQRDARVRSALDSAEQSRQRAAELEQSIDSVLNEARREAEQIAATTRNQILQLQNEAIDRARVQIAGETAAAETRIDAMRGTSGSLVDEIARDTAAAIVARIMPATDLENRVEEALARMRTREQTTQGSV